MTYAGMGSTINPCDVLSCDDYGQSVDWGAHMHRTTRHVDNGMGWCAGPECRDETGERSVVRSRYCTRQNTPEQVRQHRIEDARREVEIQQRRVKEREAEVSAARHRLDLAVDALLAAEQASEAAQQ